MHFARTEDQEELAATVRSLLARRSDSAAVRAAVESETGYDPSLWSALVEQVGVTALCIPERYDGFGATLEETSVVLEELGANLAPTPLLAGAIAAADAILHGCEEERAELLPRIAAGEVVPFALGDIVLEPAATSQGRTESMDQTLRLARSEPPAAVAPDVRDIATALITALQVGAMQRALDMTVAYSKERVQFGRPIGSFQALKHRMADMLVLLESSRSASWAAVAAATTHVESPTLDNAAALHRQAAVAGAHCGEALDHIAAEMIQLHGGIAITWEHDAHLVFKRAHALNQLSGPAHLHRAAAVG